MLVDGNEWKNRVDQELHSVAGWLAKDVCQLDRKLWARARSVSVCVFQSAVALGETNGRAFALRILHCFISSRFDDNLTKLCRIAKRVARALDVF